MVPPEKTPRHRSKPPTAGSAPRPKPVVIKATDPLERARREVGHADRGFARVAARASCEIVLATLGGHPKAMAKLRKWHMVTPEVERLEAVGRGLDERTRAFVREAFSVSGLDPDEPEPDGKVIAAMASVFERCALRFTVQRVSFVQGMGPEPPDCRPYCPPPGGSD